MPDPPRRAIPVILLAVFSVAALRGQNLLRNGSFETLVGNEPSGWTTSNIPKMLTVVSPSATCHGGKVAIRCDVKDFYGSKLAGMLTQKDVSIRGKALELSGYYLLKTVGNDAGFISVELQNAEGNTVKIVHKNLSRAAAEFAPFRLVTDIPPEADRLEIRLTLLAGEGSERLHEGSYILFDDLKLVPTEGVGEGKPD